MKGEHAACREVWRLFLDADLAKIPNVGTNGSPLLLEAVLWAADCFKPSTTKANAGWRLPYEMFFSRPPELQVVPCFQSGMMHGVRDTKSDVQSVPCYYLNNGYNHSASTVKILKVTTGECCTGDIVWTVRSRRCCHRRRPSGGGYRRI